MNVYNIETPYNYSQTSCVVAKTMADAEKAFLEKYPNTTINSITLHSKYVVIAKLLDDADE